MTPEQAEALQTLVSTDEQLGRLIEAVPAVIYEAEPGLDAPWRYVSPQLEVLIGDSPEEWISDPNRYTRRIHPADREAVFRIESDELEIARTQGATCVSEYRMLHRDGRLVWVRDEAHLVETAPDSRFWRGVLVDITLERVARTDLAETYQRHLGDRLGAAAGPRSAGADVFRISCLDCQAVKAGESPGQCRACGSRHVRAESMEGLTRQLDHARGAIEDLLNGIDHHLRALGIGLSDHAAIPARGGRRVVTRVDDPSV